MSLSVRKQPLGHRFSTTAVTGGTVTGAPGSNVNINKTAHGLVTGDYVYIESAIAEYNGIWYVNRIDANNFQIKESSSIPSPTNVTAGPGITVAVTYYKAVVNHTFNCVHLPIVYKLFSDLWPINTADTARTVSSFSNLNGYTALTLSGDIKTTGSASPLEQVIISNTASLDGVYKIIRWISDASIVIDLAYSAGHSFSGGTVQYYYSNYHARIRIYAGIDFSTLRPSQLLAEVRAIPNADGYIILNIADYIKKDINSVSNNLALLGLPNNIDFFTRFYISYAESYDDSNGYTVEEFVSSYTDDSVLDAVNVFEPFKVFNLLNDYIYGGVGFEQKFLTNFTAPVLTPDKYFDVSFIKISDFGGFYIKREIYVGGVKKDTINDTITDIGRGLYRYSIAQSGWNEDRIDISLYSNLNVLQSEVLSITVDNACYPNNLYLTWLNEKGGFDYWNFTAQKRYSIEVTQSKIQEKNIFTAWPNSWIKLADTIRAQTKRDSRNAIAVESQYLTLAQLTALKVIVSSPLVQIVESSLDKRTVLIDPATLNIFKDKDDLYSIRFSISYTDFIPSQSL